MIETVFEVRKPIGKYNILLPAYFRQVFGVGWDLFYGTLIVISFSLASWFKVNEDFYCILATTYIDLIVMYDALMSLFIRFYQSIQVVAVNRNIEACQIAALNMIGFSLDIISCSPYILLLVLLPQNVIVTAYQGVCILRSLRLYTPRRQLLDKTLYEKAFSHFDESNDKLAILKLEEFGHHHRTQRRSSKSLVRKKKYWLRQNANSKKYR